MTFEELEAKLTKNAKLDTQALRINFKLQVAFNYAMIKECEFGEALNPQQISYGIINGVGCMLLSVKANFNSDDLPKLIAQKIAINAEDHSLESRTTPEIFERIYINQNKGHA